MATVPWRAVFGNDRPVEVEIGPGRGEVLLAFAAARPHVNFLGIEHARGATDAIGAKATARGLDNLRVIAGDARCILARLVPEASIAACHVYFPDPWPKTRHRDRRLATAEFARALARVLAPGGTVHVASDLAPLLEALAARLETAGLLRRRDATPPPRPTSAFERKYAPHGAYYAYFVRHEERGSGTLAADCLLLSKI